MQSQTHETTSAVRPFHINVPEEDLDELRRRVLATRWPEQETVTDASQGVQLATTQALARYWATDYDWRKCEAKLNALPQFIWESKLAFFAPKGVAIPAAVSVFPDEIYAAPRSWTERAYPKLIHYNRLPKGGHFAAWEQPQLLCAELRAGFKSLR